MATQALEGIRGVSGILLKVSDMPRSLQFYRDTLGFAVEFETETIVVFRVGEVVVELLSDPAPGSSQRTIEEPGLPELPDPSAPTSAVYILKTDDCEAAYERLRERGVEFLGAPHDRHWGERTCYFTDPDGHTWELTQPLGHGA